MTISKRAAWTLITATLLVQEALLCAPAPRNNESDPAKAESVAAVGSEPETTSASFGDWVLRCQHVGVASQSQRVCEVVQTIQVQGQSGPVAQLAIGSLKKGDPLRLTLVLPTNIEVQKTPRVSLDKTDGIDLAWSKCIPGGCFADVVMTDAILAKWRNAAGNGQINFRDSLDRDLSVSISFRGLRQSLDALAKEN